MDQLKRIRMLIESIDPLPVEQPGDVLVRDDELLGTEGAWESRVQVFKDTHRMTKDIETFAAFQPNADCLYPGALVQGAALANGLLDAITTKRNPLTITVSGLAMDSAARLSSRIELPSHATVAQAISGLLGQNIAEAQAARLACTYELMHSLDEGFLRLGVSAKWMSGHVEGSFAIDEHVERTRVLLRLVQSYFTVSCEAPSNPVSFLEKGAKYDDFARYAGPGNPPAFVSSVTYGRMLWVLLESKAESEQVTASLDAAFNSGVASFRATLGAEHLKTLSESRMQVLALGGGGRPAVSLLQGDVLSQLEGYLSTGANVSPKSPGAPISYVVRYLRDNSIARVSGTGDYNLIERRPWPVSPPLSRALVSFHTEDDDKDGDTRVGVFVADRTGRIVASASGNYGHWDDNSDSGDIPLSVPGGATKADLSSGHVQVHIDPSGDDSWHFSYRLRLSFEDGTERLVTMGGIRLSEGNRDHGHSW